MPPWNVFFKKVRLSMRMGDSSTPTSRACKGDGREMLTLHVGWYLPSLSKSTIPPTAGTRKPF